MRHETCHPEADRRKTPYMTRRGFLAGTVGTGLGLVAGAGLGKEVGMDRSEQRLLHRIDCTQDYPPDRFFSCGPTQVLRNAAGAYREAEAKHAARFGYRFSVEQVGRPHALVVRYPDDKRRYMCIMDGTTYDLSTGVFTNWAQPLSGAMLESRQIFWPRWTDCSIVFMTWGEGEPAAATEIEVWELDRLLSLPMPGESHGTPRREFGIQYEDPCGRSASEGAMSGEDWIDHLVTYALHTGQGLLAYPMAWYHGPLFPSKREPAGGLDLVAAPDRKLYLRWTTAPVDWYAGLLERFEREGLEFQGSLTLMRLGSLMEKMNIDIESIRAGADTFNNMLWNDQVQGSTGDWTPLYNVRNFNVIAKILEDRPFVEPYSNILPGLAYGETPNSANHMGPMFNPLHPVVQEALLGFVQEIGARYGKYRAFKGISFNMFGSCMPWFGSIHSGYDDYTVNLFEQETGIRVPVDGKAPDRFSKRYGFLTYVCRQAWVSWRCRKIRSLFGALRQALATARPDLRVTVTLWDEPMVPGVLGGVSASHQVYARLSTLDLYREAGIDMTLYRDEPGLEVDLAMGNSRDRGGHGPHSTGGVNTPIEEATMYRDFDFLDQETLDAAHTLGKPGVFIMDCWVEAWGKHVWFRPEPGDRNATELAVMDGKPAERVLRVNCEYPEDGFWWDSQWRITSAFPAGVHFLEPFAHAVAELDACRITRGGLFLDKAHAEAVQGFARAYRALPAVKFDTVGVTTDPVAVRTLVRDGIRYVYVVNREYYPVEATLAFSGAPDPVHDLATGEPLTVPTPWSLTVAPYALRCFAISAAVTVTGFTATPPSAIVELLAAEAESAFHAFAAVRGQGRFIPGMDELEGRMRSALAAGRVAWLRRALTGYIVRKCRELSA